MADVRKTYESIRSQLTQLGLFGPDSLVMLGAGGERAVLDAAGNETSPALFASVSAPLAVLTRGPHFSSCDGVGGPLRACTDDMAQMFGARVRRTERPGDGPAWLIPGRGFLVTARFGSELIAACILMEKMCLAQAAAPKLGGLHPLSGPLCALEHAVYLKKYSRNARKAAAGGAPGPAKPAGDIPDLALRQAVIAYGKRLVAERLIQATWGNVSVRIDDGRFLITPSGVDYDRIRPEDVAEVRIADGTYAEGLHPSSERKMHRLIYAARPDIRAVIHTHSACCQVFAACRKDLRADGALFPCADYAVSGSEKLAEKVAAVMAGHDGCVMANHGFVAGGPGLEEAFARAAEAEALAGALLQI